MGLSSLPLGLLVVLMFASLVVAALVGARLRGRIQTDPEDDASEGYLLSATLALLGLLIGFTFSMALDRYETRRNWVVNEANALGTTWLRAGLADGPAADHLRRSLRAYGQLRLQLPRATDTDALEARTARAQTQVWSDLKATLPQLPPPLAATLVTATNELFDAASSRRAEREAHLPALVIDVLLLSALISAVMVGYVLGSRSGRRHAVVTLSLFGLLTLAIVMILDLDRPWEGIITVPQHPMELTVSSMR